MQWDDRLTEAVRAGMINPDEAMPALSRGVALGRFDLLDGEFSTAAQGFASGWPRTEMCIAAGHWAFITMRPVEMMQWLDPSQLCSAEAFAVGWGRAVAREVWPAPTPLPSPSYDWWWPGVQPAPQQAFSCAYGNERARVRSITLGEPHDAPRRCLP